LSSIILLALCFAFDPEPFTFSVAPRTIEAFFAEIVEPLGFSVFDQILRSALVPYSLVSID